jgi:hypothetical protein
LIFSLFLERSIADSTHVSFQSLNKKNKYTSISFGMGANYGNNPSLKNYIQYKLPEYGNLTRDDQLSEFSTGLEFFVGVERQVSKNFSVKCEYTYFLKSYNVKLYPQYDFTYNNHQPYLIFYYVIPQEYSFIKIGAGTGYLFSQLSVKEYGLSNSYSSNGFGFKAEVILNAQIGKSFAGYINCYANKTFLSNLKDNNGKELLTNATNETVNLSNLGIGIRLGVEIFIF